MTCKQCAELLVDYVSGELSEEFCAIIREHMGQCGPCERFLATYKMTITLTRQLPMREVPPEMKERLEAALRAAELQEKQPYDE
jgi:anti-sigma factor RsiW